MTDTNTTETLASKYGMEDYVPMEDWGQDHWSTLGYAGTVMTESGCFQVGFDPRMRQGRRNFRVMQECVNPVRPNPANRNFAVVMDQKYGTRLADKSVLGFHDDWHCVQDMHNAGLFKEDEMDVGTKLTLSEKGDDVLAALMKHKRDGGSFGTFVFVELGS